MVVFLEYSQPHFGHFNCITRKIMLWKNVKKKKIPKFQKKNDWFFCRQMYLLAIKLIEKSIEYVWHMHHVYNSVYNTYLAKHNEDNKNEYICFGGVLIGVENQISLHDARCTMHVILNGSCSKKKRRRKTTATTAYLVFIITLVYNWSHTHTQRLTFTLFAICLNSYLNRTNVKLKAQ